MFLRRSGMAALAMIAALSVSACEDQSPGSGASTSPCRSDPSNAPTLVRAEIAFYFIDGLRDGTSLYVNLSTGADATPFADWNLNGYANRLKMPGDGRQPKAGAFAANLLPQTGISRSDAARSRLFFRFSPARNEFGATGDESKFGWRARFVWSDDTIDLLSWTRQAPADSAQAIYVKADDDNQNRKDFSYCDSLVGGSVWDSGWFSNGSGTPRVQFFEADSFDGTKLDKDVEPSGTAEERDLRTLGRDCRVPPLVGPGDPVVGCPATWNNVISSLDTTGGGQQPATLVAWDTGITSGPCLIVPASRQVENLSNITVRKRDGQTKSADWNNRISGFAVFANAASLDFDCDLFLRTG